MMTKFNWDDYKEGQLLQGMQNALTHPDYAHTRQIRDQFVCYHHDRTTGELRQIWTNSFYPE